MNKKELKEKIENVPKNKYIYQRYNGLITKYIDKGDYYIDCNTGIAIEKNEHLLLGKVSENIIDLIEVGDFANGREVKHIAMFEGFPDYPKLIFVDETHLIPDDTCENENIKTILTKEIYMANCYKVGGEDGN